MGRNNDVLFEVLHMYLDTRLLFVAIGDLAS